jgi:hypothetical protein
MQEWLNLARDDVWRLRKTPPLVSFFGWLVGFNLSTFNPEVWAAEDHTA